MSTAQRTYKDGNDAAQDQHIDSRSIGGTTADVAKVQETGARLDFGGSSTGNAINAGSAGTFSSELSCDGYEQIVLKVETSKNSPNMSVRVWRKDANATGGWMRGERTTVNTSNQQGGGSTPATLATGYRHAEPVVVPTYGANAFKVEINNLQTGNAHVWYSLH